MIESRILDHLPLWAFFMVAVAVALAAGEIGYRLGKRCCAGFEAEKKGSDRVHCRGHV